MPLFVVATPIGNLEDLTFRALRTLREVDLIAAEDTRRTSKLLAHYEIRRPLVSLREHNEVRETPRLIARLGQGRVDRPGLRCRHAGDLRSRRAAGPIGPRSTNWPSSRFLGPMPSPPRSLLRGLRPISSCFSDFRREVGKTGTNGLLNLRGGEDRRVLRGTPSDPANTRRRHTNVGQKTDMSSAESSPRPTRSWSNHQHSVARSRGVHRRHLSSCSWN